MQVAGNFGSEALHFKGLLNAVMVHVADHACQEQDRQADKPPSAPKGGIDDDGNRNWLAPVSVRVGTFHIEGVDPRVEIGIASEIPVADLYPVLVKAIQPVGVLNFFGRDEL